MIAVKRFFWIACILAALFCPAAMATDQATPAYYVDTEIYEAIVTVEDGAVLRAGADRGAERVARLKEGTVVEVLDDSNEEWVKVRYGQDRGYVYRELLTLNRYMSQVEDIRRLQALAEMRAEAEAERAAAAEAYQVNLDNAVLPTLLASGEAFRLEGVIRSEIPMSSVTVEVFDERRMTTEWSVTESIENSADRCSFDLSGMDARLPFRSLMSGEKKLVIRAGFAEGSKTVLQQQFYVLGEAEEIADINDECDVEVSCASAFRLLDDRYDTAWRPNGQGDQVTISIPDDKQAALLAIEWEYIPSPYQVLLLDDEKQVVGQYDEQNAGKMINFSYELNERVRTVIIEVSDDQSGICMIRVMEKGGVSPAAQQWKPSDGKVDLMVIATHQDDELLFFGGTIPYYVAQGKDVLVIYMANCGRVRYQETLEGLWSCGLQTHPVFVGFKDGATDDYQATLKRWGKETTEHMLVELIRTYQPEVVVTHDVNGEYGNNQHKITCAAVQEAVQMAKDPSAYSEDEMDAWEVKKLYIHLYEENALTMEAYDRPLEAFDGMTATQVATMGYDKHLSQHRFFSMEEHGVQYDNRKYGLAYSAVGEDEIGQDLFENIES